MNSGQLVFRNYIGFKGVDFTEKELELYRSPNSLNMWRNYTESGRCIETRPEFELFKTYDKKVYGIHFYKVHNIQHIIIHCGTSLIDKVGDTETVIKEEGMNPFPSQSFIFGNILYIKDGINYLKYDGQTLKNAIDDAYVPTTSISREPSGGGTMYEDVNLLTGKRINTFCSDGKSLEYFLDAKEIDSNFTPIIFANGKQLIGGVDFTFVALEGKIVLNKPVAKPLTDGQDNVSIQFRKTISGYADRILKCTLLCVFDNRVFFSGNQDFPNAVFHSSLNDPCYCSDLDYYTEGLDLAMVKSMVAGNNALWVFKEPSQANTTVFYHVPTVDSDYGKIYPSSHSSIATGCISTAINFSDDIVFFSDRGLEGINGDINSEQLLSHKSSNVDTKMLADPKYKDVILAEWEGYLLCFVGNKVYLADSRQYFANVNHYEYEWFYWEIAHVPNCVVVKDGILYIGTDDGIYTLTDVSDTRNVEAHWCTPDDEFRYPSMRKTTNKRGCVCDMEGQEITVSVNTDLNEFETIGTFSNTKGFVVPRIKKKKWKSIQLKFSSNLPFKLYSCTLESYVGSYIKRA